MNYSQETKNKKLTVAITAKDKVAIDFWLKKGALIDAGNNVSSYYLPLSIAILSGDIDILDHLWNQAKFDDDNTSEKVATYMLRYTILYGRKNVAVYLIKEKFANVTPNILTHIKNVDLYEWFENYIQYKELNDKLVIELNTDKLLVKKQKI
jgi:hypothetical protein